MITVFHIIIKWSWKGPEGTSCCNPLPQAGLPTAISNTRPGCPGPHPTRPWTPPGMGHPQFSRLWTWLNWELHFCCFALKSSEGTEIHPEEKQKKNLGSTEWKAHFLPTRMSSSPRHLSLCWLYKSHALTPHCGHWTPRLQGSSPLAAAELPRGRRVPGQAVLAVIFTS